MRQPITDIKNRIFIIAGMPRGGTTFLYHNLQKHPSIFLPFRKEPTFFSFNYSKGINWYQELYKKMSPGQISFDITPYYFVDSHAIGRIKEFNPDIKVIIAVRDPVEFALSLYKQHSTFTWRMPPFHVFIESYTIQKGSYRIQMEINKNIVPEIIERYRKAFGDNLLLYSFDLFKRDPLIVLNAIESFVGVPHFFNENNFDNVMINVGSRKNIKLVSYLLSREWLISLIDKLLPHRLIKYLRSAFDLNSARKATESPYQLDDIRYAEEVLSGQRTAVREMFSKSEIILGSGKPFIVSK